MKTLQCPGCGVAYVRVTSHEGTMEKLLRRLNVFAFRCQLCTRRFHTYWPEAHSATAAVDRRQYTRLRASFPANVLSDNALKLDARVTDISMDGCTIATTSLLPQGTFLELMIEPAQHVESIKVETAMVCSLRSESMGIRFLDLLASDRHRLSRLVLTLLIGQNLPPHLFP